MQRQELGRTDVLLALTMPPVTMTTWGFKEARGFTDGGADERSGP
jgi:hypothetical protein